MKTITNEQAANILDVPLLAMGQIIVDSKLTIVGIFQFYEAEVLTLRENEPAYLESLR
jgi:hypothetical protein